MVRSLRCLIRRLCRRVLPVCAGLLAAGCVALHPGHRDVGFDPATGFSDRATRCDGALAIPDAPSPLVGLDPTRIRLVSWNLHKNGDAGWDRDLTRLARDADVMLLQEARGADALVSVLFDAGHRWFLGSAFRLDGNDTGVLTAAPVVPLASCSLRTTEPWLRIPKATMVTALPLLGHTGSLLVANVHAINFTATTVAYKAQLAEIERVLSRHSGPVVMAGDFNTWSAAREAALAGMVSRLGLRAVTFAPDLRTRFMGAAVDHVFVRGLAVAATHVEVVRSSDHHALVVTLSVRDL